jgi:hypothetical protein
MAELGFLEFVIPLIICVIITGLITTALLVYINRADAVGRMKPYICLTFLGLNICALSVVLMAIYLAQGSQRFCSENRDIISCTENIMCGWCSHSSLCVAYDCPNNISSPHCENIIRNEKLPCISLEGSYKAYFGFTIAFSVVFVVTLIVAIFLFFKYGRLIMAHRMEVIVSLMGAVGASWIWMLVFSVQTLSRDFYTKTVVNAALILGFVTFTDSMRIFKEFRDARSSPSLLQFFLVLFFILCMATGQWMLFLTHEKWSSAIISLIALFIVLTDITLFFGHIKAKSGWKKSIHIAWFVALMLACGTGFIIGILDHYIGGLFQLFIAAALLGEQFLVPLISTEDRDERHPLIRGAPPSEAD